MARARARVKLKLVGPPAPHDEDGFGLPPKAYGRAVVRGVSAGGTRHGSVQGVRRVDREKPSGVKEAGVVGHGCLTGARFFRRHASTTTPTYARGGPEPCIGSDQLRQTG